MKNLTEYINESLVNESFLSGALSALVVGAIYAVICLVEISYYGSKDENQYFPSADFSLKSLMKNDGILFYRDMAGRVTSEKTESGIDLHKFYSGYITLEEIPAIHFADPKFVDAVIKECSRKMEVKMGKLEYDSLRRQTKHFNYTLVQILSIIDSKKKEANLLSKKPRKVKNTPSMDGM
jgi:hypothetical protein